MPKRFQLSRRKGARMPAGAVSVARPSKWGNPYQIPQSTPKLRAEAVELFREALDTGLLKVTKEDARRELRGVDLGCWCPEDEHPCHADVWLEIANA